MILGLRCSASDYAYAVMQGARSKPALVSSGLELFPKGFSRLQCVHWLLQELETILNTNTCSAIVIKGFEGPKRDSSFVARVEHESAAYIAAHNVGIKLVTRKVNSTIAKELGLKGRARYLSSRLDTSVIAGYDEIPKKTQEAILAAWSGLD